MSNYNPLCSLQTVCHKGLIHTFYTDIVILMRLTANSKAV